MRSCLGLADAYRTLGLRRFRAELAKLSRVSTGFTAAPDEQGAAMKAPGTGNGRGRADTD